MKTFGGLLLAPKFWEVPSAEVGVVTVPPEPEPKPGEFKSAVLTRRLPVTLATCDSWGGRWIEADPQGLLWAIAGPKNQRLSTIGLLQKFGELIPVGKVSGTELEGIDTGELDQRLTELRIAVSLWKANFSGNFKKVEITPTFEGDSVTLTVTTPEGTMDAPGPIPKGLVYGDRFEGMIHWEAVRALQGIINERVAGASLQLLATERDMSFHRAVQGGTRLTEAWVALADMVSRELTPEWAVCSICGEWIELREEDRKSVWRKGWSGTYYHEKCRKARDKMKERAREGRASSEEK